MGRKKGWGGKMSGVGCECFVGKKCEWTKAWGGGMSGDGQ